jgi:cyclic beta-1,2-glucan synthetase
VADGTHLPLVADLLKAHEYLRLKGLPFDLVVLNEHPASYLQALQDELLSAGRAQPESPWIDRAGGVFLRRADLMPRRISCCSAPRRAWSWTAPNGGLRSSCRVRAPRPTSRRARAPEAVTPDPGLWRPLGTVGRRPSTSSHFNGIGGFPTADASSSSHVHGAGSIPPAPWANVVAHARFGFACTESGPGYTWSGNSHDNRLTPGATIPSATRRGRRLHPRRGVWRVLVRNTPAGRRRAALHRPPRAGVFIATSTSVTDLRSDADAVRPARRHRSRSSAWRCTTRRRRPRRLSVTLYAEWVLGENRSRTAIHVVTGTEARHRRLLARNVFRQEFAERVAFLDLWPRRHAAARSQPIAPSSSAATARSTARGARTRVALGSHRSRR